MVGLAGPFEIGVPLGWRVGDEIDAGFDLAEWGRRSEEFPMLRCVVIRGCRKGMFGGYLDRRTARGTWQLELRRHATVRKGCVKRRYSRWQSRVSHICIDGLWRASSLAIVCCDDRALLSISLDLCEYGMLETGQRMIISVCERERERERVHTYLASNYLHTEVCWMVDIIHHT